MLLEHKVQYLKCKIKMKQSREFDTTPQLLKILLFSHKREQHNEVESMLVHNIIITHVNIHHLILNDMLA